MKEVIACICGKYCEERVRQFLTLQHSPAFSQILVSKCYIDSKQLSFSGTPSVACASQKLGHLSHISNAVPDPPANILVPGEHDFMARNNGQGNRVGHRVEVAYDSGFSSGGFSSHIDSEDDFDTLRRNHEELVAGGFYFPSIDQPAAMKLLKRAKAGSFLIRDSAHPGYIYSVSVRSEQGATSVRISYTDGLFGFDGDEEQPKVKPRFDSLVALLDYYALNQLKHGKCLTMRGKTDRKSVEIPFAKPLRKTAPSLAHLARVKINASIDREELYELSIASLPLPDKLKQFIRDYPYRL